MKTSVIKVSICLFALVLISGNVSAQTQEPLPCGNGPIDSQLIAAHPEILIKMDSLEAFTQRFIANRKSGQATSRSSSDTDYEYTIPIVFHIIHNYGAEDITDSQVIDEVRILNEDYNKLNPDTSVVIPQFKSIASNNHMTFKLAQIDPNGDCTTGIEHIHDLITYDGGDAAKLDDWPRSEYLNIWAVAAIKIGTNDVAGYAYFPSEVDGVYGAPFDGVIILSSFVGSIGTSSPYTSRAVTHEIGHTMNLEHPWGLTNSPGVACGDDNVYDTPITEGSYPVGNCDLSLSKCNPPVIENVQNYMDYSYCSKMFTLGQTARIHAALNNGQSDRTNLWSAANLAATGVDGSVQPGLCKPQADFTVNNHYTCVGSEVTFTDFSWKGKETGRTWFFSNGNPATSTLASPIVSFTDTGWQTVTLIASNANGSDTLVQQNYIYITSPTADFIPPFLETFNDPSRFNTKWFVSDLEEDNLYNWQYDVYTWKLVNNAGYNGENTAIELYDNGDFNGDYKDLISPSFDLSAAGTYQLSFYYTGATQTSEVAAITDTLRIYASSNCGAYWRLLKTITGTQLANAGLWSSNYTPATNSPNWVYYSLNVPAQEVGKNVRFRFNYTSGGSGNNFYMDNVAINNITTGIPQLNAEDLSLKVYPDPAGENATVSYHLSQDDNVKLDLTDISGRLVAEPVNVMQPAGDYTVPLNNTLVGNLADGIYIIRLWVDGASVVKKLVVAKN